MCSREELETQNNELRAQIAGLEKNIQAVYDNRNACYLLACALAKHHPDFFTSGVRTSDGVVENPEWPVLFLQFENHPEISYHMKQDELAGLNFDHIDQEYTGYSTDENLVRLRALVAKECARTGPFSPSSE